MGVLLEFLIGTSEMFLGFMVLFMVVGLTLVLLGALGMLIFAGLAVPYVFFVGDGHDFKPWRFLLVLGVLVGLFFAHWYYPPHLSGCSPRRRPRLHSGIRGSRPLRTLTGDSCAEKPSGPPGKTKGEGRTSQ